MVAETMMLVEDAAIAAEKASAVLSEVCEYFDTVPLNAEYILYAQEKINILMNIIADYLHEIIQLDKRTKEEWRKEKGA